MRFLGGRGAWDWLGLEWVELDFTQVRKFIAIVDTRIDHTVVHFSAPVVVFCFDRLILGDVELPLPAAGRSIIVTVLDDVVVADVVVDASREGIRYVEAFLYVVLNQVANDLIITRRIQTDTTIFVRVRGVVHKTVIARRIGTVLIYS